MKKRIVLLVLISLLFFSCGEKRKKAFLSPDSQPYTYKFQALPDSLLLPEIIELTGTNAPQSLVIKPTIVPLKNPNGVENFSFKKFEVADGLSSNNIHSLAVDHSGNLWIGGTGILSKYDGNSFTNFTKANGLGSQMVSRLLVDDEGTVWVGTWDGLYKYDGKHFSSILESRIDQSEISRNGIYHLMQGPDDSIWAAGAGADFYSIKGDSILHYGTNEGLPGARILGIASLPNKGGLIFTSKGNVLLHGDTLVPFTEIPTLENSFRPVHQDRTGNIWFWTGANGKYQMAKYDGSNTVYYDEMSGLRPYNFAIVYEDRKGRTWLCTPGKLNILNKGKLISYTFKELGIPNIMSITEDKAGNLWLASFEGLLKVSTDLVDELEVPLNTKEISGLQFLVLGKEGARWASIQQKLIRYDQNSAAIYDLKSILGDQYINCLYADKKGNVWVSSSDAINSKLIHFDGEKVLVFNWVNVTKLSYLNYITDDNTGNVVFHGSGGVALFDGKKFIHYGAKQGFTEPVGAYIIDSKQRKWVGTSTSGAWVFAGDSVIRINTDNGLNHNTVSAIAEDPFGNIWLATHGGVSKFDGRKLTQIGIADGLATIVNDIIIDPADSLIWFYSVKGLTMIPFSEINSTSPKLTTYSPQNGYEIIHGLGTSGKAILDSVGIWINSVGFGSGTASRRFNYKHTLNFNPPSLELKNIRINNTNLLWSELARNGDDNTDSLIFINESVLKFGKVVDSEKINELFQAFGQIEFDSLAKGGFIPDNLRLSYANNSITFEFAAISPSFGKYIQYRYKLKGYEENWSPFSTKSEAFFGNMSEGKYTFLLEAVASFGTTSTVSYSFTVLPPWYRAWWAYALYVMLFVSGVGLFIRWRTKALQKEKVKLEEKVNTRTSELKESLENLKATQSQLIQSEKMASLGELTAGIAHEIQNPLNFVNNFSEVNSELIEEAGQELEKENIEEVKLILGDISENEKKISHHGKRADAIVKGMLQHSRSSSGQKEPTDLNALCDEYLRLAYHGLKAKDPQDAAHKSFESSFHFEPDELLPKVHVVPQDIGRVLLNLINNAFYAVAEKSKSAGHEYQPAVSVSTKQKDNAIEISVADNGNGIPDALKEKIFQPFFTTKPTGQGTGLGLSLAYDIVKAHGGEIKVSSQEGGGSVFTLNIPTK
jgi:signal transduction histidine kinase/ligand-binding sensor domain-containing protein